MPVCATKWNPARLTLAEWWTVKDTFVWLKVGAATSKPYAPAGEQGCIGAATSNSNCI